MFARHDCGNERGISIGGHRRCPTPYKLARGERIVNLTAITFSKNLCHLFVRACTMSCEQIKLMLVSQPVVVMGISKWKCMPFYRISDISCNKDQAVGWPGMYISGSREGKVVPVFIKIRLSDRKVTWSTRGMSHGGGQSFWSVHTNNINLFLPTSLRFLSSLDIGNIDAHIFKMWYFIRKASNAGRPSCVGGCQCCVVVYRWCLLYPYNQAITHGRGMNDTLPSYLIECRDKMLSTRRVLCSLDK